MISTTLQGSFTAVSQRWRVQTRCLAVSLRCRAAHSHCKLFLSEYLSLNVYHSITFKDLPSTPNAF